MTHMPSRIISRMLIQLGLGSDPGDGTVDAPNPWPVYSSKEPSVPDNCITVQDTVGKASGRTMPDGEILYHYGFQVRVRGSNEPVGWQKADAIRAGMAQQGGKPLVMMDVPVDSSVYLIPAIANIGEVLPLGRDVPRSNRQLFTINAISAIRQVS